MPAATVQENTEIENFAGLRGKIEPDRSEQFASAKFSISNLSLRATEQFAV